MGCDVASPEFTTIDGWCALTGMGRTATYEAIQRGDLTARKVGRRALVDVPEGLKWIRSRPLVCANVRQRAGTEV